MKMIELKKTEDTALAKLISEKRKASRLFRFGVAGSKAKNVKEGRTLRKDIARILTLMKERGVVR